MVTISDSAKKKLKEIRETKRLESNRFLRLSIPPIWTGDGEFGIVIDSRNDEDQCINYEGATILLMDPQVTEKLPSASLDFKNSPEGTRFTLDIY